MRILRMASAMLISLGSITLPGCYNTIEDAFRQDMQYGVSPGYYVDCWADGDHADASFGDVEVYRQGGRSHWTHDLKSTFPNRGRDLTDGSVGAFTRAQARELCAAHEEQFPGHECRIARTYPGFHGDNMG